MENNLIHQFFLILCVHCSSGCLQQTIRDFHFIITESAESFDDCISVPIIMDGCICRSVIDIRTEHTIYILQIEKKNVCLFMGHAFLLHVDTDSSSYLMLNLKFHSCHLLLVLQKHLQMFRRCLCLCIFGNFSLSSVPVFYSSVASAVSSAVSSVSQKSSTTSASASAALSSLICFASAKISPAFS